MIDFLKLQRGSNRIRMIAGPYAYTSHPEFVVSGTPHYGQKLKCAAGAPDEHIALNYKHGLVDSPVSCPLCESGSDAKRRWILPVVLWPSTKEPFLLDIGLDIFKQIQGLARNPNWGDPQKYDIDCCVELDYGTREMETQVIPIPPKEFIFTGSFDKDYLQKLYTPSRTDLAIIDSHSYEPFQERA